MPRVNISPGHQIRRQGHQPRDKAQVMLEDRLIARREEREVEELRLKIILIEKELRGIKGSGGEGGAGGKAQTVESARERIGELEVELEEAETSLKDLTLSHTRTQTSLASALSTLSTLSPHNTSLESQISSNSTSSHIPNDKSSGIEARQLRARVEHLRRQLDAKTKELARENHALARVSSLVATIQNLGREVEELRSENMALLFKFVAPVS
ncbi:hypothetical protein RQP46_008707 [Phenoliferia psychrophenolica]